MIRFTDAVNRETGSLEGCHVGESREQSKMSRRRGECVGNMPKITAHVFKDSKAKDSNKLTGESGKALTSTLTDFRSILLHITLLNFNDH